MKWQKVRFIVVLGLLALWTAVPVLACLPTHQMSQMEMECCKKMLGYCQMAQHPCCKTAPALDALVGTVRQLHFSVAVFGFTPSVQFELGTEGAFAHAHLGLPPPAPPGPQSTLRI